MDITDRLIFFLFLIDRARFYPEDYHLKVTHPPLSQKINHNLPGSFDFIFVRVLHTYMKADLTILLLGKARITTVHISITNTK